MIDVKAILARAEAATKGPWRADGGKVESYASVAWCGASSAHGADGRSQVINDWQAVKNAAFIAACREDVPLLCAEVERLRGLLREVCAAVSDDNGAGFTNDLQSRIDAALPKEET